MGIIVASGTLGVIFGRVSMGIQTAAVGWKYSFRSVALVLLVLAVSSFQHLATDSVGAAEFWRNRSEVAISEIGVIGLNQGGLIAPAVADQMEGLSFLVSIDTLCDKKIAFCFNQKVEEGMQERRFNTIDWLQVTAIDDKRRDRS